MEKIQMSVCCHVDKEDVLDNTIRFNDSGDVVLVVGGRGYPNVCFFLSLLQFNQLRAAINKFDVACRG